MPRGFLVKRTHKPGPVSYRVRDEDEDFSLPPAPSFASVITSTWVQQERVCPLARPVPLQRSEVLAASGGVPEAPCAPSCSPGRPVGTFHHDQSTLDRVLNSSSPVMAEAFPAGLATFASLGYQLAFLPSYADMEAKLGSICTMVQAAKRPAATATEAKSKVQAKRPKSEKKSCRDEVTTSPVLGLRIREDPEDAKHRGQTSSPLGGFVCQLCREQYADPLSLAQHKCSRIVRVEYRCDECDKVFSCPANLASHRRWHKPRNPQEELLPHRPPPENTKENQSPGLVKREVTTPSPPPPDSQEELYDCSHCNKKFRRQAYLRKHLALHSRPSSAAAPVPHVLSDGQASANIRDLQRPPPREDPLALLSKEAAMMVAGAPRTSPACPTQGVQQAHPCRFCPETLFSSSGLTRHINRCHPSETRQVILLQVPQHA